MNDKPTCYLEITSGILRVYKPEIAYHGPFDLSLPFVADEGSVTLKALRTDLLTTAHLVSICRCLAKDGYDFNDVGWRRYQDDGTKRELRYSLDKWR